MKQPTILEMVKTSMGDLWTIHEHAYADEQAMREYVETLNQGKDVPAYRLVDLDPHVVHPFWGFNSVKDIQQAEQGLIEKEQRLAEIDNKESKDEPTV